jgi:hypothetical protein
VALIIPVTGFSIALTRNWRGPDRYTHEVSSCSRKGTSAAFSNRRTSQMQQPKLSWERNACHSPTGVLHGPSNVFLSAYENQNVPSIPVSPHIITVVPEGKSRSSFRWGRRDGLTRGGFPPGGAPSLSRDLRQCLRAALGRRRGSFDHLGLVSSL